MRASSDFDELLDAERSKERKRGNACKRADRVTS
jgi:hypothetical protein